MDLTFSRFYHCAIENGDSPIIIGGIDLHGIFFKTTEMYNLPLGQVCQLPDLNIGRTNHGCAKIRENPGDLTYTLVVAGGWHNAKYTAMVEVLRPGVKYWNVVQPLTQWRLFTAMVNKIFDIVLTLPKFIKVLRISFSFAYSKFFFIIMTTEQLIFK